MKKKIQVYVTGNQWNATVTSAECANFLAEYYGGSEIIRLDDIHLNRDHIIVVKVTDYDEEAEALARRLRGY